MNAIAAERPLLFFPFTCRTPLVRHLACTAARSGRGVPVEAPGLCARLSVREHGAALRGRCQAPSHRPLGPLRRARSFPATPLRRETWRLPAEPRPRLSVRKHGVAFRRAGASWLKAASPLQTRMSDCGGRSPPDAGGEDSEGCGLSGAEAEPPCPPRIAPRPNLRPSSRSENADSAAGEGCGRGGWQPSGARPGSTRSKSPAFLRLFPSGGGDVGCRRGRGRDSGRVKV